MVTRYPVAAALAPFVLFGWQIAFPADELRILSHATLGLMGLALVYTGIITFRKFRTAIYPNRPAKLVVDHGIYAYTRNPMYVGMTVFYLGGVLVLHSLGAMALLPMVLLVLHSQVIVREERHLLERFPAEYADYCARVRRWL